MSAPRTWQVVREVWNGDGCLIDSTIQSAGITEQHAAALARELNDLEEEVPTYEGSGHRVYYFPQVLANG